jgi:hypothetical protein
MVSAADLSLLEFANDGADAWAILKQTGIGAEAGVALEASNLPLGAT